jgi:hypothetical protein
MRAAVVALVTLVLGGCPRARTRAPEPEPIAEPAPVEIQWPDVFDAGVGENATRQE